MKTAKDRKLTVVLDEGLFWEIKALAAKVKKTMREAVIEALIAWKSKNA